MSAVGIFLISKSSRTQNKPLRVVGVVTLITTHVGVLTTVCSVAQRPVLVEGRVSLLGIQQPSPPIVYPEPPPIPSVPVVLEALAVGTRVPGEASEGVVEAKTGVVRRVEVPRPLPIRPHGVGIQRVALEVRVAPLRRVVAPLRWR